MHRVQLVSIGIISGLLIACSSPTEPTNGVTPGVTPDFIVATGINVVRVGSSTRFTVTAYTRDTSPNAYVGGAQQAADVSASASWSSDNPAVATVSSQNIVGGAAGVTNVRARYMGREYAIPVYIVVPNPLAQQFARTWSGVTSRFCTDLIGNTRSCRDFLTGTPYVSTTDVSMSLANVGGVLQGSIDIGGGDFSHWVGPIVGGVNEAGELLIAGTPSLSEHPESQQLRDWRFTLSGAQLTGTGTSDRAFVNVYGPVWQRITDTAITLQ